MCSLDEKECPHIEQARADLRHAGKKNFMHFQNNAAEVNKLSICTQRNECESRRWLHYCCVHQMFLFIFSFCCHSISQKFLRLCTHNYLFSSACESEIKSCINNPIQNIVCKIILTCCVIQNPFYKVSVFTNVTVLYCFCLYSESSFERTS